MNNVSWHREAIVRCLGARCGTPVEVERPEVDWDGRAVCRAILPGGQRVGDAGWGDPVLDLVVPAEDVASC